MDSMPWAQRFIRLGSLERPVSRCVLASLFLVLGLCSASSPVWAFATVTLSSTTSPTTGQAGITNVNVTGSGFPAGVIPPSNVNVTLQPSASSAPSATVTATAVTTILGTVRRVTFQIPASIVVSAPTTYKVSISGMTSTGIAFSSGNSSVLTVNTPLKSFQISDFNPKSGPAGTLIAVAGNGFVPAPGSVPQVVLSAQGGGTIAAPLGSFDGTTLAFVIPTGAASGPLTVSVGGQTATSSVPLVVTTSSAFTLVAAPSAASLIQGQSISYAISIDSTTGFSGQAALKVTGLPAGVAATFLPTQITAGQTSVLAVQGSLSSPAGSSILSVSASGTVDGVLLNQTVPLTLNVVQGTTSLVGRTVVDDALETPLSRVTVTMLGKNGEGGTTGCTGSTVSDEAGNFALIGLGPACVGPQLVGYDGVTAASPPGKYAGVNLVYTFQSGQVTASPVLVHLPRIDDKETFLVQQNAAADQAFAYASIPGLSVTVYKGTTFTLADGSRPDPFPLVAVQVPVDRLPDQKPPVPTMLSAFIVAFQPANAVASRPAAVFYPNTINTPPGTSMTMMTLDPTRGRMLPYGTATVSAGGSQIIPDLDPSFPGSRYGIINFDWHGPMPPPNPPTPDPPNPEDPSPDGGCPPGVPPCQCRSQAPTAGGNPVDVSSGLETIQVTDIAWNCSRGGISITRYYRTLSSFAGPFGIGTHHNVSGT